LNFSDDLDHFILVSGEVFDQFYGDTETSYSAFSFDDATIRTLTKFVLYEVAGKNGLPLL
jgi:hypothetical protein